MRVLTYKELYWIKIALLIVCVAGLLVYFNWIVPDAIQDRKEMAVAIGLLALCYLLARYIFIPKAFARGKFRLGYLLVGFVAQVFTSIIIVFGVSIAFGALEWHGDGAWSIGNGVEVLLVFGVMNVVAVLIYVCRHGFDNVMQMQGFKAVAEELDRKSRELQFLLHQGQTAPHFLFNTLAAIRALTVKDTRLALRMASLTIEILQFYLRRNDQAYVRLEDELEQLRLLREIYGIRLQSTLHMDVQVDDTALLAVEIPSMIVLHLFENACKYGDLTNPDRPTVIQCRRSDSHELRLVVRNVIAPQSLPEVRHGYGGLTSMEKALQSIHPLNKVEVGLVEFDEYEVALSLYSVAI